MPKIGRYETLRPIGSGGMADVWLAQLSHGDATKTVAIKVIAEHLASDEEFRRLFAAEARTSMLMSHSCIAQVFDTGVHEGRSFLVMEWIDGLDLHRVLTTQRLAELPMSVDVAAFVTSGILRALSYAHALTKDGRALGIVHRDVSPHNVLLSVSGEVKLVDFGIAALATDRSRQRDVRGKLRYMPPEQLDGRSKDPRVDIYAAGAVLHEMLSGAPFRGDASTADLFTWVAEGRVPRLPKTTPGALAEVCMKMLARDPSDRHASARDALQQLRAWRNFSGADFETAELCKRMMGIAAPRAGAASPESADATCGGASDDTEAATGNATAVTRTAEPHTPTPARRRPWLVPVAAGSALACVAGVVAYVASPVSHDEPMPSRTKTPEAEAESPAEDSVVPSPTPAVHEPRATPVRSLQDGAEQSAAAGGDTLVDEPDTPGTTTPEPDIEPDEASPQQPVVVEAVELIDPSTAPPPRKRRRRRKPEPPKTTEPDAPTPPPAGPTLPFRPASD